MTVATKTLIDKIEALPPDKRAEVEDFVERKLAQDEGAETRSGLVERFRARRERLLREHGLFDSTPIIRELRENGD